MQLLAQNIRPRDIVTRKALENAATVVAASGGSTNAALHLPAIAHEAGIDFDLFDVAEIFKRTPYHRRPEAGRALRGQGHVRSGRRAGLLKTLLDGGFLHGDCLTVTGRTIAQNLAKGAFPDRSEGDPPGEQSDVADGRRRGLSGTLAPDGAIVKVAGLHS